MSKHGIIKVVQGLIIIVMLCDIIQAVNNNSDESAVENDGLYREFLDSLVDKTNSTDECFNLIKRRSM